MGLGERSAVSVFPRALCASRRTVSRERERNKFKRKKKIQNGNQRGNDGKREKKLKRKRRTNERHNASSLFFSLYLLLSVFRFHFYSRRSSIEHVMMRKSEDAFK